MTKSPALKTVASILVLAALCGGCAQTPPPPAAEAAPDPAKVEADALVWFEHYANADGAAMASLYAEDALLMPPGAAAVTGRPAIQAYLGDDAAKSKAAGISLKNASVTGSGIEGDLGWVSGTYTVHDASGATIDSGNYLSIHRLVDGKWLYIRDIWNSDRAPGAPPAVPVAPTT